MSDYNSNILSHPHATKDYMGGAMDRSLSVRSFVPHTVVLCVCHPLCPKTVHHTSDASHWSFDYLRLLTFLKLMAA